MELPEFILGLPQADVPFDETMVKSHALSSKDGLLVFFEFLADFDVPAHSHGAQWGTVLEGEVGLTVDGVEKICRPGDSYSIPAGAVHSVRLTAGTKVIDFFEEPDRYTLKQ
ncbi:MAG: cupin domain-containing protein [Salaquimonas sp.]|jgi:quercetin dioxygenase-like cupin family protein|nr:cupin domain-containing protein [Salaquimonas sp.]